MNIKEMWIDDLRATANAPKTGNKVFDRVIDECAAELAARVREAKDEYWRALTEARNAGNRLRMFYGMPTIDCGLAPELPEERGSDPKTNV